MFGMRWFHFVLCCRLFVIKNILSGLCDICGITGRYSSAASSERNMGLVLCPDFKWAEVLLQQQPSLSGAPCKKLHSLKEPEMEKSILKGNMEVIDGTWVLGLLDIPCVTLEMM